MHELKGLTRRSLAHAVATLALIFGSVVACASEAPIPDPDIDAAVAAYERNHWEAAYAAFASIADRGHPEAARIALHMWRHGPRLYRTTFAASDAQRERWSLLWVCGGEAPGVACRPR